MQENKNLTEIEIEDQKIIDNKELNIWEALIPVVLLMCMYNKMSISKVLIKNFIPIWFVFKTCKPYKN